MDARSIVSTLLASQSRATGPCAVATHGTSAASESSAFTLRHAFIVTSLGGGEKLRARNDERLRVRADSGECDDAIGVLPESPHHFHAGQLRKTVVRHLGVALLLLGNGPRSDQATQDGDVNARVREILLEAMNVEREESLALIAAVVAVPPTDGRELLHHGEGIDEMAEVVVSLHVRWPFAACGRMNDRAIDLGVRLEHPAHVRAHEDVRELVIAGHERFVRTVARRNRVGSKERERIVRDRGAEAVGEDGRFVDAAVVLRLLQFDRNGLADAQPDFGGDDREEPVEYDVHDVRPEEVVLLLIRTLQPAEYVRDADAELGGFRPQVFARLPPLLHVLGEDGVVGHRDDRYVLAQGAVLLEPPILVCGREADELIRRFVGPRRLVPTHSMHEGQQFWHASLSKGYVVVASISSNRRERPVSTCHSERASASRGIAVILV